MLLTSGSDHSKKNSIVQGVEEAVFEKKGEQSGTDVASTLGKEEEKPGVSIIEGGAASSTALAEQAQPQEQTTPQQTTPPPDEQKFKEQSPKDDSKTKPPPRHTLFTGDTLFCGGHGACFEGTQTEMFRNFYLILLSVSPDCLLFPGHEYSSMLLFSQLCMEDRTLHEWSHWSLADFAHMAYANFRAQHRRGMSEASERVPTVPLVLKDEVRINPSFRVVLERRRNLVSLIKTRFFLSQQKAERKEKKRKEREEQAKRRKERRKKAAAAERVGAKGGQL
eukprot:GSA25T00024437001.1